MSNIINISGVRGYIDQNGVAQLNLEDVSRGLGFVESKGDYIRWQRVLEYLEQFKFSTSGEKPEFIPENIFYRLAMKAKNETAEAFQSKVADEILPTIRKTGGYIAKPMSQLEILAQAAQALAEQERQLKELAATQTAQAQEIQGIRDVVALNPNDWRKDATALLNKAAQKLGGYENLKDLRAESYKLLDERFGVNLKQRLTNKRRRMAEEGVSQSKRDNLNFLDIITEDKKLIEGYLIIVKELAIKSGV